MKISLSRLTSFLSKAMNARNSNGFNGARSRTTQQDILERMMQTDEDPRAA